jgi:hypothetical protein
MAAADVLIVPSQPEFFSAHAPSDDDYQAGAGDTQSPGFTGYYYDVGPTYRIHRTVLDQIRTTFEQAF